MTIKIEVLRSNALKYSEQRLIVEKDCSQNRPLRFQVARKRFFQADYRPLLFHVLRVTAGSAGVPPALLLEIVSGLVPG